jgi:hypothetical protein
MVSPKTRGIRGRGTLLKRSAAKKLSGGLIALICALFSIGLTLEGLSMNTILNQPFNLLSLIGLIAGSTAIIVSLGLWREGRKMQNYWKRKRKFRPKWLKKKEKEKKDKKKEKEKKEKKGKEKKETKKKKK